MSVAIQPNRHPKHPPANPRIPLSNEIRLRTCFFDQPFAFKIPISMIRSPHTHQHCVDNTQSGNRHPDAGQNEHDKIEIRHEVTKPFRPRHRLFAHQREWIHQLANALRFPTHLWRPLESWTEDSFNGSGDVSDLIL